MKDRYVSQRVVARVMLIVLLAVATAAAGRVAVADEVIFEGFDSPDGFTSTHPDQFVFSNGELNWTVCRGRGIQYLSRSIPSFSGDVRITVRGRINSYVNNHWVWVGIGDEPLTGVGIQFGFTGGGCARQGLFIWGEPYTQNELRRDGLPDDAQPDSCSGWYWTWLHPALGQYYTAELVISEGNVPLTVPGLGSASGSISYDGPYDTLFIANTGGANAYCLNGTIDWVEIEPLGNIPPTVDAGGPYSGDEGSAIPLDGATASDPDGDLLDYSWSVDDPDTCSFDDASALNPNLTCSDDGTYQVTLTVDDGVNDPVSDSASVEVNNVPPTFEAGPDETLDPCVVGAFSRAGITFSDPGDDVWSGTVNWGDSPADELLTIDQVAKSFDLSHTYAADGDYLVTVVLEDDDGGIDTDTFWVHVAIDSDCDGVLDVDDVCWGTLIPESVPTVELKPNRWALVDGDFIFDTVTKGKGNGPGRSYTTADTAGCSCEQIIAAQGLGEGHTKYGCSISAMDEWVALVGEY